MRDGNFSLFTADFNKINVYTFLLPYELKLTNRASVTPHHEKILRHRNGISFNKTDRTVMGEQELWIP